VNDFDDIARDNLDQWIYFLKNSEIKDEFNARGLAEAREKLKEINLPEEELSNYRRYLEQLRFEASVAQTIRFDIEYAKKEKTVEMAKKLKEKGIDIAVISETSGLSKEEIEKL